MSIRWDHIIEARNEVLTHRLAHGRGGFPPPDAMPTLWGIYAESLREQDEIAYVELQQYAVRHLPGGFDLQNLDYHFKDNVRLLRDAVVDIVETREEHLDRGGSGIPVFRGLGFTCPDRQVPANDWHRRIHWNNIGSCWAYRLDGVAAYQKAHDAPEPKYEYDGNILVYEKRAPCFLGIVAGEAPTEDVNWSKTLYNLTQYPGEFEIRLKPGTAVHVTRVGVSYEMAAPQDEQVEWDHVDRWAHVHTECGSETWRPRR